MNKTKANEYKSFKILNPSFSEAIADIIKEYYFPLICIGENIKLWHIGIDNKDLTRPYYIFQSWECASYLEASHTKKYFVEVKGMVNDNEEENIDETFIYIYRRH